MPIPGLFSRRQSEWQHLLAGAIAVVALLARVLPGPRTIDDAFITFRYARNLLAGHGFVFNAGERVLGTTTPLYTLLLAAVAAISGATNYPWIALLVNSAADALTCLVLIRLGELLSGRRAVGLAVAALWAIAPMSVTFAIGGMETSVFILLLALTGMWYVQGHRRRTALAAALLLLARPDGLLLAAPLAVDYLVRQWRARRLPAREAGVFVGVVAPWLVFASYYFGSPVPHSILAKSLAYRLPPEEALVRLIQHYGTPFFENQVLGRWWPLPGLVLYLALSLLGGLVAMRRNHRVWPLVAYPWLYFAAFALANPLIFRWYLAPPLPFYFLFIVLGLSQLLQVGLVRLFGRQPDAAAPNPRRPKAAGTFPPAAVGHFLWATAIAGFFLSTLGAWTLQPDHGPQRPAPEMAWHQLELYYAEVGQALAPVVTADTIVAAGDVGALGYYSRARILDTVGLMSPEVSAYYPLPDALYAINYAVPPDLIVDQAPDYVVILEAYGRKGLLRDARFTQAYSLADRVETDIYGSDGLLIFRRKVP